MIDRFQLTLALNNLMNNEGNESRFVVWWSLMAGGVIIAENAESINLFLPHEIIEVDAVNDDLVVIACPYPGMETCSFTLNPESALPSVAEKALNSGLPIAQFAASQIRLAKEDQAREDLRLNALVQAFCQQPAPSVEDQYLSAKRNRMFMIFPILTIVLFAAMIYYGHEYGQKHTRFSNLSLNTSQLSRQHNSR